MYATKIVEGHPRKHNYTSQIVSLASNSQRKPRSSSSRTNTPAQARSRLLQLVDFLLLPLLCVLSLALDRLAPAVLRRLGALAASPSVEGVVITPGAGLDLGEPLWDGSRFTAVLVGEPGGLVPDIEDVQFLPLLPMTPNEAAWKRVHGAEALEERWLAQGRDLRDPHRPEADLA